MGAFHMRPPEAFYQFEAVMKKNYFKKEGGKLTQTLGNGNQVFNRVLML
jgi:hypothetical protein